MDITFRNHPAQARHPDTREPLVDAAGDPVPMFPELRAIYLDGVMCGYCSSKPGAPVTLTRHLPLGHLEVIEQRVAETFGQPTSVNMPPLMPTTPLEDAEDE